MACPSGLSRVSLSFVCQVWEALTTCLADYIYATDPPAIDGGRDEADITAAPRQDDEYVDVADDSTWYKGKARDDHRRRTRAGDNQQREEDPIEVIHVCLLSRIEHS